MTRLPLLLGVLACCAYATHASAQSGSGRAPRPAYSGSGSAPAAAPRGSGSVAAPASAKVGLDGYCTVCQVKLKKWVAGSPQHQAVYDGVVYRFPGAEQQAMFQADPAKYAPALSGDDVVVFARTGRRTPGKTAYGARYLGRLYFFGSEASKQAFQANPAQFANVDLALGGQCAVCRVDMNQGMAGSAQFTAVHNGLRYQFAGAQQKQAFEANPKRYAVSAPASAPTAGSGRAGSGSGTGSGSGGR